MLSKADLRGDVIVDVDASLTSSSSWLVSLYSSSSIGSVSGSPSRLSKPDECWMLCSLLSLLKVNEKMTNLYQSDLNNCLIIRFINFF